jgi:hypothetical protein
MPSSYGLHRWTGYIPWTGSSATESLTFQHAFFVVSMQRHMIIFFSSAPTHPRSGDIFQPKPFSHGRLQRGKVSLSGQLLPSRKRTSLTSSLGWFSLQQYTTFGMKEITESSSKSTGFHRSLVTKPLRSSGHA